jgi:hypothetical protein
MSSPIAQELAYRRERVQLVKRCLRALRLGHDRELHRLLGKLWLEGIDDDEGRISEYRWSWAGMPSGYDEDDVLRANLQGQLRRDQRQIWFLEFKRDPPGCTAGRRTGVPVCHRRAAPRPRERRARRSRSRSASSSSGEDSSDSDGEGPDVDHRRRERAS